MSKITFSRLRYKTTFIFRYESETKHPSMYLQTRTTDDLNLETLWYICLSASVLFGTSVFGAPALLGVNVLKLEWTATLALKR